MIKIFFNRIIIFYFILLSFGCAISPLGFSVKPSPMRYSNVQGLLKGERELLGKTKEEVLKEYGKPEEVKQYTLNDVQRQRYSFHFEEEDFAEETLLLDVYFIDDKVSGFNAYSGERPLDERENVVMTDKFVFQGM